MDKSSEVPFARSKAKMLYSHVVASCLLLSLAECSEVLWGTVGGSVTINCRTVPENNGTLKLMRGLNGEDMVLRKTVRSSHLVLSPDLNNRILISGVPPNYDLHISNLSTNDTSVYLCGYQIYERTTGNFRDAVGNRVMLVVQRESVAPPPAVPIDHCGVLVQVAIGISSALLIGIFLLLVACIIKKKILKKMMAVSQYTGADVYEEMRGTARR